MIRSLRDKLKCCEENCHETKLDPLKDGCDLAKAEIAGDLDDFYEVRRQHEVEIEENYPEACDNNH